MFLKIEKEIINMKNLCKIINKDPVNIHMEMIFEKKINISDDENNDKLKIFLNLYISKFTIIKINKFIILMLTNFK